VLGNPENRRVALFQAALAGAGQPPATVVPWLAFLRDEAALARALTGGALLRLESPGEDAAVERELIARGAGLDDPAQPDAARIDAAAARALPEERGRLLHPRQWWLGLREALAACARALAAAPGAAATHAPEDVAVLFEKRACQARLEAAGVPVPPGLDPVGSWEELRARMRERGRPRVFVKLAAGSSASGVVALETRPGQVLAHTTVELVRDPAGPPRLYNSLRVRRYRDERDVAAIVDAILREGARVEAWLPKASLDGRCFDLRVLALDGRARHVVVRTSRSPLTNLHLGNRRGDPAAVRALLGEAGWGAAMALAARAAAVFPRCRQVGVDLLVGASLRRCAVLELNAFGDLLPHVLHEGLDTYAAQVAAFAPGPFPREPVVTS
jgi:hypothetical protein